MAHRTDAFDLAALRLSSGEGRRLDLDVALDPLDLGNERYVPRSPITVRLDVSRTTGSGYALRLRFAATLDGPCMRCLAGAAPTYEVDAREISQPGQGDQVGDRTPHASHRDLELESPYVTPEGLLDLYAWARDALALELPTQILCRADCAGLCPACGVDLNDAGPDHAHEAAPDPRWSKLSELKFD